MDAVESCHGEQETPICPMRITAQERIKKMISAEENLQSGSDYVALSEAPSSFQNVTWRERVAQWCYDVIDHLDLPREVVYTAMNILDRYIATNSNEQGQEKGAYEAAAITSLFLAIRISGTMEIKVNELLCISRSSAQARDIQSMGSNMLETLTFSQQALTPTAFVKAMMSFLTSSIPTRTAMSLFELASYLVEITVCDQQFCSVSPQEIAYAALIIAMSDLRDSIERKTFTLFLHMVQQETGLNPSSARLKSLCSRLRELYERIEDINQSESPHVVLDDEGEESSRKRSCEAELVELENGIVDLRPAPVMQAPKRQRSL